MGYKEKLTVDGKNITFFRTCKPTDVEFVESEDCKLLLYDITEPKLMPTNYDDSEGSPLPLFKCGSVRVDLSKRTKKEMSYWHRSLDYYELIICYQGSIIWETELGKKRIKQGQLLVIPKGVAHRSIPDTEDKENIFIEFKIWASSLDELTPGQEM